MTTEQYIQPPVGTTKQTDPFWYRKNSSATYGVTPQPSNVNPNLGIDDIVIKPGSQAQLKHKILASGLLKTIVGSISFQIKLSHANNPFVQTISTENGVDEKGEKLYWEHIILKPAVKAQIMRFYEALQTGQPIQPATQAYSAPNPYAPAQPVYQPQMQQPMYQAPVQPMYQAFQQQVQAQPMYPDYSQFANLGATAGMPEAIPAGVADDDLPV
jgi:cell division protein FtsN